jgi:transposase
MVVVDGQGVPVGSTVTSASPAEVKLVEETLATIKVPQKRRGRPKTRPRLLTGDKAYDSDKLRLALSFRGIKLLAPHRKNRKYARKQTDQELEPYRRRWKVERTFAWLGNFRRLVVRWDRLLTVYMGFFHLACIVSTLRQLTYPVSPETDSFEIGSKTGPYRRLQAKPRMTTPKSNILHEPYLFLSFRT